MNIITFMILIRIEGHIMIRLTPGVHLSHFYQDAHEFIEGTLFLISAEKSESLKYLWIYPDEFDLNFLYKKIYDAGISISTINLTPVSEWFHSEEKSSKFDDFISKSETIRLKFNAQLSEASREGYNGICVLISIPEDSLKSINPYKRWSEFFCELALNSSMIMMCQYDISLCSKFDIIDITSLYEYILTKRFNKWTLSHNIIHHEMKRELERSRDFYLTLLDDFPSLIWRSGLNGECNYFNKNWLKFTGRTIDQEIGTGWTEGVHPDDFERCISYYLVHFEKKLPFSMEYRLKRYDGDYRWIVDMGMPFYDFEKNFAGYIGSCYDITDHKDLERSLIISKEDAQKANTAKSIFLSNMSHDIRTPMAGVIGMLELITKDDLTLRQKNYLTIAQSSANLLIKLINDILDLSKIEAGKLELNYQSLDLEDLLNTVTYSMRPISDKKNLYLKMDFDMNIPNYLLGDSVRISQILLNLVGNAIKFTDNGGVTLSAKLVEFEKSFVSIKFIVKDTGIGISNKETSKIFESFNQVSTPMRRNIGGTGLGLSISKKLVLLLGGDLTVESKIGAGSSFSFILKFEVSTHIRKESENNANVSQSDSFDLDSNIHKKKILIVEDDEINMLFLKEVLGEKFIIDTADNGASALEFFKQDKFDIILMDVQMPIMNGYDATIAIRLIESKEDGHTPIIGFTAFALSSDVEKCISVGMDSYITKPIDSLTLINKIKEFL